MWVGTTAFAGQIYCDFSGYSLCAIGVAKCIGFQLPTNFRFPLAASGFQAFWSRWHISLSTWLRDYLYIPLGGNRRGRLLTYRNLMLTMLLGGLWHGAAWTFVVWGAFHGAILCIHRAVCARDRRPEEREPRAQVWSARRIGAMVLMFHIVCLGWLFFRVESFDQATHFLALLGTSFNVTPFFVGSLCLVAFYAGPMSLYELWAEKAGLLELTRRGLLAQSVFYSYCLFCN